MAEDVFEIVGTVVGGAFSVEAVVAEGGFAVVYRAYHGAFHAPVALKCLKVPTVGRTSQKDFLERFREEGELLFRLSQSIPAVVRPLHIDAFETSKGVFVPYMALEWLDGEALDVMIARRAKEGRPPMNPKKVVRLLAPVARALSRAHKFPGPNGPVSIIHRDLKPDNIVVATVNGEEVVKILDFGIAKVRSVATHAVGRLSQDGTAAVPFTPGYAAPEQWLPKRYGQTGPWTDVWGLAITTVEALTGKAVIDGDHAAMMGTAIDDKRRPTPRTEGANVSDEVEAVFLKALEVDPRSRYQDVGTFWDDLESALGLQKTGVTTTGFTPQPMRDPRSEEGMPAALEERVGSVMDSQRPSHIVRTPGNTPMGDMERRADTAGEPPRPPPVPDFELELTPPPVHKSKPKIDAVKAPELGAPALPNEAAPSPARRSSARLEPVRFSEAPGMDLDVPAPATKPTTDPSPDKAAAEKLASDRGQGIREFEVPSADAGIDLAVSPVEMRRASSASMKAVNPAMLAARTGEAALPPAARSGAFRAVSAQSAPVRTTAGRPFIPAPQPPSRKIGVPIALSVAGIAIAIAYYINSSMGGGRWAIGPVPINWIAGSLAIAGMVMLFIRLLWRED